MRVIINSCLVTELFANFQTSIDRKSIIGETHSVEEMEKLMLEFAKIKPSDGKTVIFECKCIRIIFRTYSSVWSEQLNHNQKVGGSKPSRSTSVRRKMGGIDWYSLGQCINLWELEQWSARWVYSPEVVSSNLAFPTKG